jgi:hypothetical protein
METLKISDITLERHYLNRRNFFKAMGFLSTSGLLAACDSGVETCEVEKSTGKPKQDSFRKIEIRNP